jgi:signal transduction histidine kinase
VHRSQSHEGTGLGLPLCRMFTELHNGKLTLISSLGEGTTVRLQFPEIRVINDEELQPQSNNNFAA